MFGKGKSRRTSIIMVIVIIIVVVRVLSGFPVIRFNDKRILVFSLDRIVAMTPNFDIMWPRGPFRGTVVGNHILETEHGQITLRHSAYISASGNLLTGINIRNFQNGLASHNLVIEGIEMPANINISFNLRTQQISFLALDRQEISVSDISLIVTNFFVHNPTVTADIMFLFLPPDYIVLADTTKIHFAPSPHGGHRFLRHLHMFKDNERWVITGRTDVRFPGRTEFIEYSEITFRSHWGEFIVGELFE